MGAAAATCLELEATLTAQANQVVATNHAEVLRCWSLFPNGYVCGGEFSFAIESQTVNDTQQRRVRYWRQDAPSVSNNLLTDYSAWQNCSTPPPPPFTLLSPLGPDTGTSTGGDSAGGSPPGSGGGGSTATGAGLDGPPSCSNDGAQTAKPITPATGEKIFNDRAYSGTGANALSLVQHFRSTWSTGVARVLPSDPGLGHAWAHNHAVSLVFAGSPATTASVLFGDGSVAGFAMDSLTSLWKPAFGTSTLAPVAGGGFRFTRSDDESQWLFDAAGRLSTITLRNGWITSYTYSDSATPLAVAPRAGLLIRVTNNFGRFLGFVYNAAGQLTSVSTPDTQNLVFSFDSSQRLSAVGYPGGISKNYVYEDANWPKSVTGIVDERGLRLATVVYDAQGRATSSGYALGADLYSVAYPAVSGGPTAVTDPLGTVRTYNYGAALNKLAVTSADKPSGAGLRDAASRVQNASGLIDSETDFLGIQTLFTWDTTRRLPLATTRAANRPEAQTTSTQWHASFRLPLLFTEPGRSTAYTYDALGNKLTETVTDTAAGQARTWAWSYNAQGLVATSTDPRGSVSTFTYDALGNTTSFKNALNQTTAFTHDGAGRVLTQADPNGLLTTYTYDARGRVLSIAQSGSGIATETTAFTYTPSGQVASVAQPSGYAATYTYDAAQRLVGAADNRGNTITYVLDAMGNRTREETKDSTGAIARLTTRTVNQLNRLASVSGATGQTSQFTYDANAEPANSTDPLNQTTRQTLDALRRPIATTLPDNAVASQSWSALNEITSVTDPKGVATQYTRNAFGEVTAETSPDSGSTTYSRDAGGLITSKTDARGQTTTYTRDALGRATTVSFADGKTHQFSYDSVGNISQLTDPSGTTSYTRNVLGQVLSKLQTVADSPTLPTPYTAQYLYHPGGGVAQITYPSGLNVYYRRNAAGQITSIDTKLPGTTTTVKAFMASITHSALQQPKSWAWRHCTAATLANCVQASRTIDTDGRLTANEFATYTYDAAGRITGLTHQMAASRSVTVNGVTSTVRFETPLAWNISYDNRDRITRFARARTSTDYTYDTNSNRLGAVTLITSDTDLDGAYTAADTIGSTTHNANLASNSNRLMGFSQALRTLRGTTLISSSTSTVTYSRDAAGNLTGDGLRTFDYDASNRHVKTTVSDPDEGSKITYLYNALGQRTFKSEPQVDHLAPNATQLGSTFVNWLLSNFSWLFAAAQTNATLGQSYLYDGDQAGALGQTPVLLGEYGNGAANSSGRLEYIWLPTQAGQAIPVGLYRAGELFAIHSDHLGTPRRLTNSLNRTDWQLPYSAFGETRPTGTITPTTDATLAFALDAATGTRLATTSPPFAMNLRFAGQYFDSESNLNYNYFRSYQASQGRYTQSDPIGLEGGLNRMLYAEGNTLSNIDPMGLAPGDRDFGIKDPGFWKWWEQNKRDYGPFDKSHEGFNPKKPFDLPNAETAKDYQKEYEQCKTRDSGRGGKVRGGKPNVNDLMKGGGRSGGRGGSLE